MTLTFDLFLSDLSTIRSFLKLVILTQGTILYNSQVVSCLGAVRQLNTFLGHFGGLLKWPFHHQILS